MNSGIFGITTQAFAEEILVRRILVGADTPAPVASIPNILLPPTGKHLRIVVGRSRTDSATGNTYVLAQANGDSGANYVSYELYNSGAFSGTAIGALSGLRIARHSGSGDNGQMGGNSEALLPYYSDPTIWKVSMAKCVYAVASPGMTSVVLHGNWANTAPISTITLLPSTGNFVAGSSFELYVEY